MVTKMAQAYTSLTSGYLKEYIMYEKLNSNLTNTPQKIYKTDVKDRIVTPVLLLGMRVTTM